MPEDKTSIIKLLGLPEAFAVVLLILSLILALAPYLPGKDFGIIKIPDFTPNTQNKLKLTGPIIFLVSLMLFLPLMTSRVTPPIDDVNRNGANNNRNDDYKDMPNINRNSSDNKRSDDYKDMLKVDNYLATVNNGNKNQSVGVSYKTEQHLARAIELYKQGKYQEAIAECDKALAVDPMNQEAFDLKKRINESIKILNSDR